MGLPSSERAQFSVVVHNVRIIDCSPSTESPVVFDSMSEKSFFDLCVRTRGPLHADLIRVDLFDLNLAYGNGKAEKIVVNTGEDFVWRLLDIANRTALATAELAGVDLDLKWDEGVGKFKVSVLDSNSVADDVDAGTLTHPYSFIWHVTLLTLLQTETTAPQGVTNYSTLRSCAYHPSHFYCLSNGNPNRQDIS